MLNLMPSGPVHKTRNTVAGIAASVMEDLIQWGNQCEYCRAYGLPTPPLSIDLAKAVLMAIGSYYGGSLPDLLEPAHHPNHRQEFHSAAFGLVVILSGYGSHTQQLNPLAQILARGCAIGYANHLLDDAYTPKSIRLW